MGDLKDPAESRSGSGSDPMDRGRFRASGRRQRESMDQSNATRLRKHPEGVRKAGVWYVYPRSQEKKGEGPGS
jgi:hypothetical protein